MPSLHCYNLMALENLVKPSFRRSCSSTPVLSSSTSQLLPPLLPVNILVLSKPLSLDRPLSLVTSTTSLHLCSSLSISILLFFLLFTTLLLLRFSSSNMILSLLLPFDTSSNVDVDARRSLESECASYFSEVERGNVENGFERVGGVGLNVGSESIFR